MKNTIGLISLVAFTSAVFAQHAAVSSNAEIVAELKASFAEKGIAKLDRLDQTPLQATCTKAQTSGKGLDTKERQKIQLAVYESIPYPKDGKYLGDWQEGEKIAQNGRGMQFSDKAGVANGANCYACHQLSPTEVSFGNIGPSLLQYGRKRGIQDPNASESLGAVKYTWARIWNAHAFNACSNMPRFGDAGILTQEQITHVMALLLDPMSPVNK